MIQKTSIQVPGKRISIKKSANSDTRYVYYVTEYYKSKGGNNTNKSMIIGKLDPDNEGMFFPNNNYYELFDVQPPTSLLPTKFAYAGSTFFLAKRCEQLGVTNILQSIFPKSYKKILSMAIYMMHSGNVMLYMDDFYSKHLCAYHQRLSQKHLSELYEEITKEKRWDFFHQWKELMTNEGELICYDVTSISTGARDIAFSQKGYNRDHEMLPQVNVGMFFSQNQELPLCYEIYNGSITDQTFLTTMMDLAEEFEINPFIFVMDKGFVNTDNVSYLHEEKIPFLLSVPAHHNIYKKALLEASKGIRKMENYIDFAGVFGEERSITIEGNEYTLYCYFDSEKAKVQEATLFEKIHSREETLEKQIGRKKRKNKDDFFNVEMDREKILSFTKKEKAIEEALSLCGMFGLMTNIKNGKHTPSESLRTYRRRNDIEAHYDSMKNSLDFDRLRTHKDQTTEGKFFIGFIAQILQADLLRVMNKKKKKPVPTIKSLILDLEQIQRVDYKKESKLMAPVTKRHREILALFGMTPEELTQDIIRGSV